MRADYRKDCPYSAQECFEAIVLECVEGFKALNEMHARPYRDKQRMLKDSAALIAGWAERLADSV